MNGKLSYKYLQFTLFLLCMCFFSRSVFQDYSLYLHNPEVAIPSVFLCSDPGGSWAEAPLVPLQAKWVQQSSGVGSEHRCTAWPRVAL